MPTTDEQSLALHARHQGKIETDCRVPLNSREDLSLSYTPGVAAVSRAIADDPTSARRYTVAGRSVAVVTDGSAVLGLGNIGPAAALPVMEGKAALFKRFGDVDAWPICLATQDTEEIIAAVRAIAPTFGGINLEDISAPRCFDIEARLRTELHIPVMHDDQWGTAIVVLAGLANAVRIKNVSLGEVRIVVNGAGAAGVAITRLLQAAGATDITLCDSRGIIVAGRADLNPVKTELATSTNPRGLSGGLADALREADVFIGVSQPNLVTAAMVQTMRPQPIVFAMANPTPEIMPDVAAGAGALVVATGRSDFPNQVNNVLAFPGIFRGALRSGIQQLGQAHFLAAAQALAALVPTPTPDKILPSPFDDGVAEAVATAVEGV